MIPNSSKYPPRPWVPKFFMCFFKRIYLKNKEKTWVPKGSLKVMVTLAMESRFHVGPKIMFEKRREMRFWTISLPGNLAHCVLFQLEYFLNRFFTEVMVNPVELVLAEEFLEV